MPEQTKARPILAINFDGVLVEHKYPEMGNTIPEAVQGVQYLGSIGCHNTLWTCRTGVELAQAIIWVHNNNLEFKAFNSNVPGLSFNPMPKIYADLYIDDRNAGLWGVEIVTFWNTVIENVHMWIKDKTGEDLGR